jgi:hypothetical protein
MIGQIYFSFTKSLPLLGTKQRNRPEPIPLLHVSLGGFSSPLNAERI